MAENVLVPGIYDSNSSLSRSFWNLAKDIQVCEGDVLLKRLADIVVKYFYAVISPNSLHKRVSENRINKAFYAARVGDGIDSGKISPDKAAQMLRRNPYHTEQFTSIAAYQLRMLGDVGATIAIMQYIINSTLGNQTSNEFHGLDLGSGTGIMLLALYLQSLKQKRKIQTNCGIEINPEVAARANDIICRLGIGEVRTGDACNSNTLREACSAIPSMVINENVPSWGSSATNSKSRKEPFFQILQSLLHAYGMIKLRTTNHFPQGIGVIYWKDGKYIRDPNGNVWGAIGGEKTYGTCEFPESTLLHGTDSFDFQQGGVVTMKASRDEMKYRPTYSIGQEHIGTIVMPIEHSRERWGFGSDIKCILRVSSGGVPSRHGARLSK